MKILVLNSGSSSIKFKLFGGEEVLAEGVLEKVGQDDGMVKIEANGKLIKKTCQIADHKAGLIIINDGLKELGVLDSLSDLDACGHRIVHGAELITRHCVITPEILADIEKASIFAPLHNPANIAGVRTIMSVAPAVPNVAVFDTAFHQSMPKEAFTYPLPYELYEKDHIRSYGFHGTSHSFVSKEAARMLKIPKDEFSCIVAHLGNGSSVCAVKNGRSVDTSMGFTPLEGLMMGTRCGDIDPAILPFLMEHKGMDGKQIDELINKKSGFLGICGISDLRDIQERMEAGDELCKLAFEMFCYRVAKYIGAYLAILPKLNALIFTAGIGENSKEVRESVCSMIAHLGFEIDAKANDSRGTKMLSTPDSKYQVMTISTNEELEIARICVDLLG